MSEAGLALEPTRVSPLTLARLPWVERLVGFDRLTRR